MPILEVDHPEIPAHEFALMWPAYSAERQAALTEDIDRRDLLNAILLYDDELDGVRYILDGVHRYASMRSLAKPIPYELFEGTRLEALAVSSSLNALRRHLDTQQMMDVAARELVAMQSGVTPAPADAPRPTVEKVATSIGVSKRHFQRALASERERVGVPSPPGRERKPQQPAFMRDTPEPSPLDDVARLVRRLKDIPPPGQLRANDDAWAAALTAFVVEGLERGMFGAAMGEDDVLAIDRPGMERAHVAAMDIVASLPLEAKRRHMPTDCLAARTNRCTGNGKLPPAYAERFRLFCDRCIY